MVIINFLIRLPNSDKELYERIGSDTTLLATADEIQSDKVIVCLKASCSVAKMLEANKMDFIMHYTY